MFLKYYIGSILVGASSLCALLPGLWLLLVPLLLALLVWPFLLLLMLLVRCRRPAQYTVAFFHPYCNAGGGGERVLWTAIKALQTKYDQMQCTVYTGDVTASPESILASVQSRFGVTLPRPVNFVYLKHRSWVEAQRYPAATMLFQSLGSVLLGWEALLRLTPHVFVDSMGYAFTLPLFRVLGGCHVLSYVHYPTISTDMLGVVASGRASYNNQTTHLFLRKVKLLYYRAFAVLYGLVGRSNNKVMVNSRWTQAHICHMWGLSTTEAAVVYPPCDVTKLLEIEESAAVRKPWILSVAQFRPEKNHALQIKAFAKFLQVQKDSSDFRLVLVGSCRGAEDHARVEELRRLAEVLGVEQQVDFKIGIPLSDLKLCFAKAYVGLHSMWNEHFGIGVVEMMAAGLVVLAHDSGGPQQDIVVPTASGQLTGFLADSEETYSKALENIFSLSIQERLDIVRAARTHVQKFDEFRFSLDFLRTIQPILKAS